MGEIKNFLCARAFGLPSTKSTMSMALSRREKRNILPAEMAKSVQKLKIYIVQNPIDMALLEVINGFESRQRIGQTVSWFLHQMVTRMLCAREKG